MNAARILLDKALPSLRPIEAPVLLDLPADGIADQGRAVLAAVADGKLAPTSAAQLIAAMSNLSKVVETAEILKRLEALENDPEH